MPSPAPTTLRHLLPTALLLALVLPPASVLAEGTPRGAELQVNSFTTSFQAFSAVAVAPDGSFVVGWTSWGSYGNDSSYTSVQARKLERFGAPSGQQLQVNSFTPLMQGFPILAAQPDGGFVVGWSSFGSVGGDTDAYSVQARRLDANGAPLGDPFQVNVGTTGTQCCGSVAALPGGEFVIVWSSDVSSGTDTSGSSVQARRYDGDGTPLGGELQVNAYTTSGQGSPVVAPDPAGGFVVAWESSGSSGSDSSFSSIQVRRFDAGGLPLGDDLQVNTDTPGLQGRPRIAAGPSGGFVVVWESDGVGGGDGDGAGVQARIFDASGLPLGDEFRVNTWTTGAQERAAVSADARGFVVVWASAGSFGTDSDRESIQKREFLWDGTPLGAELQVNTYTTGAQSSPAIAADPFGDFVVTWQSAGSAGTDTASTSIQARLYDALLRDGFESGDASRWSITVP